MSVSSHDTLRKIVGMGQQTYKICLFDISIERILESQMSEANRPTGARDSGELEASGIPV